MKFETEQQIMNRLGMELQTQGYVKMYSVLYQNGCSGVVYGKNQERAIIRDYQIEYDYDPAEAVA